MDYEGIIKAIKEKTHKAQGDEHEMYENLAFDSHSSFDYGVRITLYVLSQVLGEDKVQNAMQSWFKKKCDMKDPVSIMGRLYDINDVIQSLKEAGCNVVITEDSDRYDIQEAMESLNLAQSNIFWGSLLPKSIGKDKPLAVIRV